MPVGVAWRSSNYTQKNAKHLSTIVPFFHRNIPDDNLPDSCKDAFSFLYISFHLSCELGFEFQISSVHIRSIVPLEALSLAAPGNLQQQTPNNRWVYEKVTVCITACCVTWKPNTCTQKLAVLQLVYLCNSWDSSDQMLMFLAEMSIWAGYLRLPLQLVEGSRHFWGTFCLTLK